MGQSGTQKKSGGGAKIGKNKDKCAAYRKEHRRFKNKLRRVLKSNGPAAAEQYRKDYHDRLPRKKKT